MQVECCKVIDLEIAGDSIGNLHFVESLATDMFLNIGKIDELNLTRTYFCDCCTRGKKSKIRELWCDHSMLLRGEFQTFGTVVRWSDLITVGLAAEVLEVQHTGLTSVNIEAESASFYHCEFYNTKIDAKRVSFFKCSGDVELPEKAKVYLDEEVEAAGGKIPLVITRRG